MDGRKTARAAALFIGEELGRADSVSISIYRRLNEAGVIRTEGHGQSATLAKSWDVALLLLVNMAVDAAPLALQASKDLDQMRTRSRSDPTIPWALAGLNFYGEKPVDALAQVIDALRCGDRRLEETPRLLVKRLGRSGFEVSLGWGDGDWLSFNLRDDDAVEEGAARRSGMSRRVELEPAEILNEIAEWFGPLAVEENAAA